MVKHGVVRVKENFEIAKDTADSSKWEKVKKNIKYLLITQRSDLWKNYIHPLIVQGKSSLILKAVTSPGGPLYTTFLRGS